MSLCAAKQAIEAAEAQADWRQVRFPAGQQTPLHTFGRLHVPLLSRNNCVCLKVVKALLKVVKVGAVEAQVNWRQVFSSLLPSSLELSYTQVYGP